MDGAAPLGRSVRVRFVLTLPAASAFACDLDDFVTGICDGLQRADPASSSVLGTRWHDPRLRDIHPTRFGAISDDREIVFIQAEKRFTDDDDPSYVVEISGE